MNKLAALALAASLLAGCEWSVDTGRSEFDPRPTSTLQVPSERADPNRPPLPCGAGTAEAMTKTTGDTPCTKN